jgi:Holliday junction resolvase-like predicted endonuclease
METIFWFGHAFESWLQLYLEKQGYEFLSTQQDYNYHGITGHSDFVVSSLAGEIS